MSPDLEVVAAREVKKELTPSYKRSYRLKNAVYDDINQRGALDGKYGEREFGVETRKQSQEGKMSFRLPFPPQPLYRPAVPSFPQEPAIQRGSWGGRRSSPHRGSSQPESSPSLNEAR